MVFLFETQKTENCSSAYILLASQLQTAAQKTAYTTDSSPIYLSLNLQVNPS